MGTGTSGRNEMSSSKKQEARIKSSGRESGMERRMVVTARNGPSFLAGTITSGDVLSLSLAFAIFLQRPQGWLPSKVLAKASETGACCEKSMTMLVQATVCNTAHGPPRTRKRARLMATEAAFRRPELAPNINKRPTRPGFPCRALLPLPWRLMQPYDSLSSV